MGGENVKPQRGSRVNDGSSPRGRGKHEEPQARGPRQGLIPAWAGKTIQSAVQTVADFGSSPRGRGKPLRARGNHEVARLIPAWAGKTCSRCGQPGGGWAHPRVGGENALDVDPTDVDDGSSPRGRGKLRRGHVRSRPARLIPAWAGKTRTRSCSFLSFRAHPRVGGENARRGGPITSGPGSSPRGRGKQRGRVQRVLDLRLIPAWAGKTSSTPLPTLTLGAHPRVGGENLVCVFVVHCSHGSSPRGRGKLGSSNRLQLPPRLIPAWAGKTSSRQLPPLRSQAHPRVGGENRKGKIGSRVFIGSSPRGRGKLHVPQQTTQHRGLIPAWAGKTLSLARMQLRRRAHPRVGGENLTRE